MPKRDDQLLINDILVSANHIFDYTENFEYDDFINDQKTIDAVVRNFEIIGEATKMISEELKIKNPLIEWREIGDFRNKLIHDYFGIDYEVVWDVIHTNLMYNYTLIKLLKF